MKTNLKVTMALLALGVCMTATAADARKDATKFTKEENKKVTEILDFNDTQDFRDASKGFIATWPDDKILDADGNVVWDFKSFEFLNKDKDEHGHGPDTVNPSLWRQSKLNNFHGVFEVVPGIYQVRGFDLGNITFMKGETGWIVIDTCTTTEIAKAAYELVTKHVEKLPIAAIVVTHSHADHFGGMLGLATQEDVRSGKVKVVAPANFFEESVSENVIVGNAMSRRASFMYGTLLPRDEKGTVDGGLGKGLSIGEIGILEPSHLVDNTGDKLMVDGVEFEFIKASGTEAPSEFMFHIPKYNAFCPAEVANHTLHNISTLRGAKTRDALKWANVLDEAYLGVKEKGDTVMFAPHHWPIFGNDRIAAQLGKHRDMYKFLHDQTVRMANAGYNPEEIGEAIKIPRTLEKEFFNRGYYGTVNHNVKGVFDFYFGGWWDGKPANLFPLPPTEAAKNYVAAMGGEAKVMTIGKNAYAKGEYRWVVELIYHVILANPKNQAAKNLQADAMEQLGYQAESAPWRAYLLSGVQELRNGVTPVPIPSKDGILRAVPLRNFLDFLAVLVDPVKAEGVNETLNIEVTDTKEDYSLELSNSTLKVREKKSNGATATLTTTREAINEVLTKKATLEDQLKSGKMKIDNLNVFMSIFGTFEEQNQWFSLVESNAAAAQSKSVPKAAPASKVAPKQTPTMPSPTIVEKP